MPLLRRKSSLPVTINGETYYSVSAAARTVRMSVGLLWRWVEKSSTGTGVELKVLKRGTHIEGQDAPLERNLIAAESVLFLKSEPWKFYKFYRGGWRPHGGPPRPAETVSEPKPEQSPANRTPTPPRTPCVINGETYLSLPQAKRTSGINGHHWRYWIEGEVPQLKVIKPGTIVNGYALKNHLLAEESVLALSEYPSEQWKADGHAKRRRADLRKALASDVAIEPTADLAPLLSKTR